MDNFNPELLRGPAEDVIAALHPGWRQEYAVRKVFQVIPFPADADLSLDTVVKGAISG